MASSGPDFVGIGMQKCGTTYLFEALRLASGVRFPATAGAREWLANPLVDGRRLNTLPKEIQFLSGPNEGWSWEQYLDIFADRPPGIVQGEISPAYADAPVHRIAELADRCPQVRLFAVLRDPVARDWSAIRMIAGRQGVLDDAGALRAIANLPHVRAMGSYGPQLRRWLSVFPRDRFLFLSNEMLDKAPERAIRSLLSHIGAVADEPLRLPATRIFTGPPAVCPPEIASVLAARHADALTEIAELSGLDVSAWTGAEVVA